MYQNSEKITLKRNEFVYVKSSGQGITQVADGKYSIDVEGDGNGIILMVDNEETNPREFTLIGSENVFCGGNKKIYALPNGISYIHLEAAPYVQMSGENKGKILIECSNPNVYFTCVEIL